MVRVSVEPGLARAVYRMFYNPVESNYWHQMEAGNLRPGSDEAEVLLTSIRIAQSQDDPLHYAELNILHVCLNDWASKGVSAGSVSRPSSAFLLGVHAEGWTSERPHLIGVIDFDPKLESPL